jgi:hypothetical protein
LTIIRIDAPTPKRVYLNDGDGDFHLVKKGIAFGVNRA